VVIFELVDRPRINSIEFLGNRGFADKKLLKTVGLKVGEPLNTYEVEEGRRKLEEHYRTKGYPKAVIGILEGDQPEDQAVVYVVSEGYLQRIASVTFEGNTFASDGQLKTKVESKPGFLWLFLRGKFDRQKLDADVEKITAYYRDFGYFRARVSRQLEFDENGQWVDVKFIIDEGQRYNVRSVSIVGNQKKKMRSEPLLEALDLKDGKPYNRLEMDKDLQLIKDLYGSQGHIFTDAVAEPRFLEEPGQIDLVYKIQEGEPFRVGQINVHIAGEFPHTRRNVVLNRLSVRPGDLIDIREIRNSERRLRASQLFESEATGGEPPKIVVRPPELKDSALVGYGGDPAVRGQSPDPAPGLPAPIYDVDVFLPPLVEQRTAQGPPRAAKTYTIAPLINGTRRLPPIDHEE
jgi:outer membrane protein insertion porin family